MTYVGHSIPTSYGTDSPRLRPDEFICAEWERSPGRFVRDPTHDTLGLYT